MATSLAQQLAKLAVPQTTLLHKDKKRASLLFDPKEAATLTRETVYLIGKEGYEELLTLNHLDFQPFTNNLFSAQSKDIERAIENRDFNSELNKNVRKFLSLLSPYFLRRCTHKSLEWLIHRFHIHEYNIDELLFLALPYHETNIFVRILQVIKLRNNDKWLWLKPLQRPGVHLPKSTLFTHAASDCNFLNYICDNVLKTLKINHYSNVNTLVSFYCTTFMGAIEYTEVITEAHITSMIPAIMRSLTHSYSADFCAASYMILAKLCTKTPLVKRLLNTFVEIIAPCKIPSLKIEAALLLVIIYQHQIDYKEISDKAFLIIANHEWFCGVLQELMISGSRVKPLLKVLFEKGLMMVNNKDVAKFLKKLVNLQLGNMVPELIRLILSNCDSAQFFIDLLETIQIQYPNQFDETINKIMQSSELNILQDNFKMLTRGNLNSDFKWCAIIEKIHHPVASIRQESVDILIKNYNSYSEKHQGFFKSMIIDRFNDDNVDVIYQCLISDKILVSKIIDRDDLVGILNDLLQKSLEDKEKYRKLIIPALDMLIPIIRNEDFESLIVLTSFFKPKNVQDLIITDFILDEKNGLKIDLFKNVPKYETVDKYLNKDILSYINSRQWIKSLQGVPEIIECLQKSTLNKYSTFKATCIMFLVHLLADSSLETSNLILDLFILTESHLINNHKKPNYFQFDYKKDFPLEKYLSYLEKIIENTSLETNKNSRKKITLTDFSVDSELNKFVIKMMDILTQGLFYKKKFVSIYAGSLNMFLDKCAENLLGKIIFCLNIASADSKLVSRDLQMRCLIIVQTIVENRENIKWESKQDIVLALLLINLKKSQDFEMGFRNVACSIISKFVINNDKYSDFFEELLKHKDEILLDLNQLPQILHKLSTSHKNVATVLETVTNFIFDAKTNAPLYIQANYLDLTILLTDIDSFAKTAKLANEILATANSSGNDLTKLQTLIITSNINRLTPIISPDIKIDSPVWDFIKTTLLNDKNILKLDKTTELQSPSVTTMAMINRDFYSHLKSAVQNNLLDIIITITSNSDNSDIITSAGRVFKHIELNASAIIPILTTMRDLQSAKTTPKQRNRRVSVIPTVDLLGTEQWRKGARVLELIQDKKKFTNTVDLIPILFDLLKKCLDFDEQSNVEYPKQLVLASILQCCQKNVSSEGVPVFTESVFNMSLIVQCMRSSWNPQTHHHTLVLLAHCATFSPNQVLHNIMAIFTFMGSSYLRHDDAYSFQIITNIIDSIIPILIKTDTVDNILSVLGVFVDALIDVPEHRRVILYCQFLRKLNSELYISYFVLLIFRNHVKHANAEKKSLSLPKRLDILTSLLEQFDAKTILTVINHIMTYLRQLPVDKDTLNSTDLILATMKSYSSKEFRHYKYTIVQFLANLLSSQNFLYKIASLSTEALMTLEPMYKNLIIHSLTYIQVTTKISDKNSNTPQAQYWKILVHHSYDILDSVNALLTPQMFLLVIKGLLTHSLATVRRRALELLNAKLQSNNDEFFDECEDDAFNDVIVSLVSIVKTIAADSGNIQAEHEVIVQTALLALKLITRVQAEKQPEKFVQLLTLITELIKCKHLNVNVMSSLILCLAELCNQLKMHSIANLTAFMPVVVKILKSQRNIQIPNLLLVSLITALQKIVDCLSLFLTPYLQKIICELTHQTVKLNNQLQDNNKIGQIVSKIDVIWDKIATSIQPRVLIPLIEASYNNLIAKKCFVNIEPLMKLLSTNIETYKTVVLESHVLDLTAFFLNALQFRSLNKNMEDSAVVESRVMNVFIVLILKLSERSFRPLFYKLYDWALRCDDKSERVITFYNLTREISSNLKGLFVLFAGHFLNNASAILDQCNLTKTPPNQCYFKDTAHNVLLVENVLATLKGVFEFDTQKFINKERFDVLMQPLVDQLENQLGGVNSLKQRAETIITPAIVHFAFATGDDSLWKQLNYQVCLKMRNADAVVRIIAVECLTELVKKIGDDFLPLLPETIPFLAELLEDEIEEVEKVCRKSIQEMEGILGEPLQKYF